MARAADEALAAAMREQWGRLLALLVAQFRRLDLAEEGLAEAFESAATHWPSAGMPGNPPAWLLTAARRRVLDRLRAEALAARRLPLLVVDGEVQQAAKRTMADPGGIVADERLRLAFLCAHPALRPEAASALTLRLVLGVPTADIARLFLVSTSTMAARLTRAKTKLAVAGVPFVLPQGEALGERVSTVAEVAYLAFTAGYAPGSGADVVRTELAAEAIRLTRVLRELMPGQAVFGPLLALMLLQHARRDARVDDDGALVLLPEQDRTRWHGEEIAEATALLGDLDGAPSKDAARYVLQARIAAEHGRARTAADTRWDRIAALYGDLERLTGSPVVRMNRAVAVAEAFGPLDGLELLNGLDGVLTSSHRLAATRAELLVRAGDLRAARSAYDRAIALCGNDAQRRHLGARLAAVDESLRSGADSHS